MAISNPNPGASATDVPINAILDWDGDGSVTYSVYFGTNETKVTNGDSDVYRGDVTVTEFDPRVLLTYSTEYFWRIDTSNDLPGITGTVYSFTVISSTANITGKKYKKRLTALADDKFWYEDIDSQPSDMIELAGLVLDTSEPIDMVEAYQKIFIVNGAPKWVVDFSNTKVVGTISGRITRGMILVGGTNEAQMVVDFWNGTDTLYGFNTTALTFIDTEVLSGTNKDGEAVSITLTANGVLPTIPHYYTWTTYGNITDPTDKDYKGEMPALATVVSRFRGRVVLSGNSTVPHSWDMTRQDNPFDLLFLEEDAASAVLGQNAAIGQIGDVVVSLMPYNDDYLIYGCSNSVWILAGDPAGGGSLDPMNETTGIMGRDAWAKDGDGNTYIVGTDGIYRVAKNLSSFENITMAKIPTIIEDLGLDADKQIVTIGYDGRQHGLVIGVTTREDGSNENFWYDLRTNGFFPESYPEEFSLFSQFYYKADNPEYKRLVVGCNDGLIRTFDTAVKNDEGTAIDSYVVLGPKPLSTDDFASTQIAELVMISGGGAAGGSELDTDGLQMDLFVKDTSEEVTEAIKADVDPQYTYTQVGPGRAQTQRPRVTGLVAGVKLLNGELDETWAIEKVTMKTKPFGRKK